MSKSKLEQGFMFLVMGHRLPTPVVEYRFSRERRWRFDFAWPEYMIAVELEGGIWTQGRHTRGAGVLADMEKYNAATITGWRVLRYAGKNMGDAPGHIKSLMAGTTPRKLIEIEPGH